MDGLPEPVVIRGIPAIADQVAGSPCPPAGADDWNVEQVGYAMANGLLGEMGCEDPDVLAVAEWLRNASDEEREAAISQVNAISQVRQG